MREEADFSFPRERRLRKKKDFDAMFCGTFRASADGLTLRFKKNGLDCSRMGSMIGKKSGNAVERNRIKRVFREVFRTRSFRENFDILLTLYRPVQDKTRNEISDSLHKLLNKVH